MTQKDELTTAYERIAALEQELKQIKQGDITKDALVELANPGLRVRNPKQFLKLFGEGKLKRDAAGNVIFDDGVGLPKSIKEWVFSVQLNPGDAHHFHDKDEQKRTGPTINPFMKKTWNLTQQGQLFRSNPALARELKQAAEQAS